MDHEADSLFEQFDEAPPGPGESSLPGPLSIRCATTRDTETLGQLSADREGGDAQTHSAGFKRAIESGEIGRASLILVAEVEHEVIGFGKLRQLSEVRAEDGSVSPEGWYLTGVVVDPRFRRRGVGARLTGGRLKWISERSRFAYYFSNARNAVSIALHEHFGFVEVSRGTEVGGVSFVGGEGMLFRADLIGFVGSAGHDHREASETV